MSQRKPIIGITPTPMEDTQSPGTVTRHTLATSYVDAVEAAGGIPLIIPPQHGNSAAILDIVDGLLLSGGADIRPERYGDDTVHPMTYGVNDGRDDLEIELARGAVERDLPVLCICRGIQILNVALGGTLVQDIPDQYATDQEHAQSKSGIRREDPAHSVRIAPGTLLARTYESETVEVNSFHHQALKDVAPSLEVNGTAPDEIIEAVARPESSWILGLQWHPEMMFREHPEHLKPFTALVQQASRLRDA